MENKLTDQPHVLKKILRHIQDSRRYCSYVKHHKAVVKHGTYFTGISRPKGFRQMRRQACFGNAMRLVLEERATYVEGFIMTDLGLTHHAWVTLDGAHAIDVTLPDVVG